MYLIPTTHGKPHSGIFYLCIILVYKLPPSPSSCPHCPHCCARPHSAPAQSSHLANPKCLNMDVRPLTRALRRFRGCHVPAGPVRRAPSRCARPAIEVTFARCDNTSSWESNDAVSAAWWQAHHHRPRRGGIMRRRRDRSQRTTRAAQRRAPEKESVPSRQ